MRIPVILLALGSSLLLAQSTSPGSIQGTVTDDQNKPIAGALVSITRTFATPKEVVAPYSQSVKTASDGSFLAQGLPPGSYSYCAQVPGDGYLNGCHWGQPLLSITVSAGQKLRTAIRVAKGSILKVRVLDPSKIAASLASQQSNGKASPTPIATPPIQMGVWDGHGRYLPAHNTGGDSAGLNYQVTIPFDTPLSFQVVSSTLKLSDSAGVALPAGLAGPAGAASSASQTAFQHNSGDPNPKSFQFTITGVNP
jgi:hypothetical protein